MRRALKAEDLPFFPNLEILSYTKENGYTKDYLVVQRRSFISCLVVIDNNFGVFVQQYRPVIDKTTCEVPMGKLEPNESPLQALERELQEECHLFIGEKPHIKVKNSSQEKHIDFTSISIEALGYIYPSPGFSYLRNYQFIIKLSSEKNNFMEQLEGYSLFSTEEGLEVFIKPLTKDILNKLCGISQHYLLEFFCGSKN